jgi:hypothetical protein
MKYVSAILPLLALAFGCSSPSDSPHYPTTGSAGSGGGGPATSGTGSGTGSAGTGSGGSGPALPLVVDDYYAASGYMGDGETGGITDSPMCDVRAGDKRGLCHKLTWKPGAKAWAGVYWQYPDGNWGTTPGLSLPAGATQISFWAWGAKGGEKIDFFAGMDKVDGFHAETGDIVLTTTPTHYVVNLSKVTYSAVVGAFGWSTGTSDGMSPVVFSIDDIEWQAVTGAGCTDMTASNYMKSATVDDGSCQYPVTFQVDMKALPLAPTDVVTLQATFNKWCGDCAPLADPDKDGVWTLTVPLPSGDHQYKYTTNGWNGQVEDVPLACDVTGGAQHNRGFSVAKKALTLAVAWSTCPP